MMHITYHDNVRGERDKNETLESGGEIGSVQNKLCPSSCHLETAPVASDLF